MKILFKAVLLSFLFLSAELPAQKNKKTIESLREIEEKWHHAYVTHDSTVLDEILSEDFIILGRTGGRLARAGVFKNFREDKTVYEYVTPYDMEFRIYSNCAIVMGKSKEKGVADGKPYEAKYFWKDIFIKAKGKWHCVMASNAKIEDK